MDTDSPTPLGEDDRLSTAIAAAQLGDSAAFGEVYRAVQPRLLRYLTSLVGADAEDVASETWLQISRDLKKFTGSADAFRGWCASIGRHRALDHLRAIRRRPVPSTTDDSVFLQTLIAHVDIERDVIDAEATHLAILLIAALPRDQAEAVLLRVVMGLDVAAAAEVLGKRPGAVRAASHRGLRKLAEQLAARAPAAGPVAQLSEPELKTALGVTLRHLPTLKGM